MTELFLGTHMPNWLGRQDDAPLFVSHRRFLHWYKSDYLPSSVRRWALDSGGFTELSLHGGWVTSPAEYVKATRRYKDMVGNLAWASPQDWMCEPLMLAKTGRSVEEHQKLTVENYLDLRMLAPDLPFIPVLQGWEPGDYQRHVEDYARAGVDLTAEPLVGVGTVCRRQNTSALPAVLRPLAELGLRLHGFGVKITGLRQAAQYLASADSMAWSYAARIRQLRLPGCTHKARLCGNCYDWAHKWYAEDLVGALPSG